MRACRGIASKKSASSGEAGCRQPFVVERARADEFELRPMLRVAVDLPMVELDGADGLIGGEAC